MRLRLRLQQLFRPGMFVRKLRKKNKKRKALDGDSNVLFSLSLVRNIIRRRINQRGLRYLFCSF